MTRTPTLPRRSLHFKLIRFHGTGKCDILYARRKTYGLPRQFFEKFVPNSTMFRSLIQNFTQIRQKILKVRTEIYLRL